jgi:hypothetical protein
LSSVSVESFISATVFWIWGQGSGFVRRGAVRSRTQFSQWWIWVLELFFVSRAGSLPQSLFSIGGFLFVCSVYLLLPSTCFELQVSVLFLGSWILVGFWSFVPISSSRQPDFVFLWLAVACSLVLPCRKTVPLVSLPTGRCASRSSVSVAARVMWSL